MHLRMSVSHFSDVSLYVNRIDKLTYLFYSDFFISNDKSPRLNKLVKDPIFLFNSAFRRCNRCLKTLSLSNKSLHFPQRALPRQRHSFWLSYMKRRFPRVEVSRQTSETSVLCRVKRLPERKFVSYRNYFNPSYYVKSVIGLEPTPSVRTLLNCMEI